MRYIGITNLYGKPMMQNSTPISEGPSARTLEFLKKLAHTYKAESSQPAKHRIALLTFGQFLPIGES